MIFKKKPYQIKVKNESVYCTWLKDIMDWTPNESDEYLSKLRLAVQKTVKEDTWKLLTSETIKSEDKDYQIYVETVRKEVIARYGIEEKKVKIGLYHGDMLVLSLEVEDPKSYPYYFMGIQLKPYKKKEVEPGSKLNS